MYILKNTHRKKMEFIKCSSCKSNRLQTLFNTNNKTGQLLKTCSLCQERRAKKKTTTKAEPKAEPKAENNKDVKKLILQLHEKIDKQQEEITFIKNLLTKNDTEEDKEIMDMLDDNIIQAKRLKRIEEDKQGTLKMQEENKNNIDAFNERYKKKYNEEYDEYEEYDSEKEYNEQEETEEEHKKQIDIIKEGMERQRKHNEDLQKRYLEIVKETEKREKALEQHKIWVEKKREEATKQAEEAEAQTEEVRKQEEEAKAEAEEVRKQLEEAEAEPEQEPEQEQDTDSDSDSDTDSEEEYNEQEETESEEEEEEEPELEPKEETIKYICLDVMCDNSFNFKDKNNNPKKEFMKLAPEISRKINNALDIERYDIDKYITEFYDNKFLKYVDCLRDSKELRKLTTEKQNNQDKIYNKKVIRSSYNKLKDDYTEDKIINMIYKDNKKYMSKDFIRDEVKFYSNYKKEQMRQAQIIYEI